MGGSRMLTRSGPADLDALYPGCSSGFFTTSSAPVDADLDWFVDDDTTEVLVGWGRRWFRYATPSGPWRESQS